MGQVQSFSVLDRMFDSWSRCLDSVSAQRVSELDIDPVVQARVEFLAERAKEGLLRSEEKAEYEVYIHLDDFISILKRKASRHPGTNGSS